MTITSGVLRIADAAADMAGLLRRPILAETLIARAQRRSGLSDFGDVAFIEPLRRLLASCSAPEADLSLVGRLATQWDVVRFLTNLLRFHAEETARPEIAAQTIERPIFITGLPRSGTTFLHRLMMTDPANRAPLVWETIFPWPDGLGLGPDQRARRVARQLKAFERLAPEFRDLHPLDATSPQECSEITAHMFRSLRFDTNYYVPAYRQWLDADVARHVPAYEFHRRFLQHLQYQDRTPLNGPSNGAPRVAPRQLSHGAPRQLSHVAPRQLSHVAPRQLSHVAPRQWILKCPEHVFALRAIRTVYPDARLIFVHRDPVKVLLSVARLTEVLRRPFSRNLDPNTIGRDESARWLAGAERMMEIGDDAGLAEPVCHVHHMDLISDPAATVEGVYRHFGMQPDEAAMAGIERYVAASPNGGYGARRYAFRDHGLDEAAERDRFRPYMLRFGIAAENAKPGGRRGTAKGVRTTAEGMR